MSLEGSLLLAHPGLLDPNFRRTVLFLSSSDAEQGAFGLVINRTTSKSVGEVLANKALGALARVPVQFGGPVQRDQLIFAAFRWKPEARKMECQTHLLIPEAEAAIEEEHTLVRAFVGYSGWGKGQLEMEMAQKSWLVAEPLPEHFELERMPGLWREIASKCGPRLRLLAEAPDEPGWN